MIRYPMSISNVRKSQRRSDIIQVHDNAGDNNAGDKYLSMRDEMTSAVGALLGKAECQKRLACLSGRHLAHVNGASSIGIYKYYF